MNSKKLFSTFIGSALFIFTVLGILQSYFFGQFEKREEEFRKHTLDQEEFFTRYNSHMGYGGAIHNFKNYILRKDRKFYFEADRNFRETRRILGEFKDRFPEHSYSIKKMELVIDNYIINLKKAEKLFAEGYHSEFVDKHIFVDDKPALIGAYEIIEDFREEKESHYKLLKEEEFIIKTLFYLSFLGGGLLLSISFYWFIKMNEQVTSEAISLTHKKEQFVRRMAHEIRTPLNAILGFQSFLEEENLSPDGRDALSSIQITSKYLSDLINDILDFSKLKANKLTLHTGSVDELEFWKRIESVAKGIKKENQDFKLTLIGDNFDHIEIDEIRLKQIVLNLLSNSFKFTPEDGMISLEIEKHENKMLIIVTDSGIGMSSKDLVNLFDDFHQAERTSVTSQVGTGLGMSITHAIVKLMKGTINATSDLGKGTQIRVTLPVKASPKVKTLTENIFQIKESSKVSLNTSLKILLVEDNKINIKLMSRYFEKLGVTNYSLAFDGEEAVQKVQEEEFDLVFMDLQMPKMDGIEATQKIRTIGIKQPVIIGLSANLESRQECIEAGMDDFIPKPISREKLVSFLDGFKKKAA